MNELAAFGVGVIVGGVLAIASMVIVIIFINRAIDNDEDLGRGRR